MLGAGLLTPPCVRPKVSGCPTRQSKIEATLGVLARRLHIAPRSKTMPDIPEPEDELSFEQALGQLERIVDVLERGESDLSTALSHHERSIRLLAHCHGLLERAEQAVALLAGVDAQGNPITAPFDATATITRQGDPPRSALGGADIPPSPEPKQSEPPRSAPRKVRAAPEVDAVDPFEPPF
jgi:exodeoxyribonuclease VII small subunit